MSIGIRDLFHQLATLEIISRQDLETFQRRLPSSPTPQELESALAELVKAGKLTRFQAKALYQGKGSSLQLGNYLLLNKLGGGGMGMVFKARHRQMERVVAIKILPPEVAHSTLAVKRFRQEVRAIAKLSHPNIVAAHDADRSAAGVEFLVMEYIDGSDLQAYAKRHGPLSVHTACQMIVQAARGLQHAHQHGVVHRDLKPGNLLLDKQGLVKVLDLGLARLDTESDGEQLTKTGTIMGTVDFMAPEQASDTRRADCRADVYSLGCTLYFLITGEIPYRGSNVIQKIIAHRLGKLPHLPARSDIPPQFEGILHRLIAKKVEDRCPNMDAVIALLAPYAGPDGNISPVFRPLDQSARAPALETLRDVDPVAEAQQGWDPGSPTFISQADGSEDHCWHSAHTADSDPDDDADRASDSNPEPTSVPSAPTLVKETWVSRNRLLVWGGPLVCGVALAVVGFGLWRRERSPTPAPKLETRVHDATENDETVPILQEVGRIELDRSE